jgi:RNA polymerase sigma-70 factor, ECF subfamily
MGLNEHTPVHTQPTEPKRSTEFTTFMRAYQDMVFSTAVRLTGDDAQAEDIAQEAFLKAYEHFGQLRTSPTAGGWLKTVTTNLTLNHLGRYRKRWRLFSEMSSDAAEEAPPELQIPVPDTLLADLGAEQRGALIDAALLRLPQHQRLALVLYHFEELSYEEIAERLHASLSKIKTDIRRARAAMLPLLQSSGIECAAVND